jgi:stage II sporulation protein D
MRRALLPAGVLLVACARPELSPVATAVTEPEIRVGLALNVPSAAVGGGGDLLLEDSTGGDLAIVSSASTAIVSHDALGLRVRQGETVIAVAPALTVVSRDSGTPVRLNGRDYRGRLVLTSGPSGLIVANALGLETYLAGVVAAEMGRREGRDFEALKAQAVVSRTVAARALGRWRLRGYDLVSTVADQAYAGIGFEYPLATQAVEATRGEVLYWDGRLIDAFFHSTCAGRTADGSEIFVNATAPYLRSIRDEDEMGRAWCSISPRWRWREEWSGDALVRMLRETLPVTRGSASLADELLDLRVIEHTATGRVARLAAIGATSRHEVTLHDVRRLLRPVDTPLLRSATFSLQATREGGRLIRVVAEGAGAGHGVGMCQWGAMGRSRAGVSYRDILSAYFSGTQVGHTY